MAEPGPPRRSTPDRVVTYDEARATAESHGWREKVLVYLTRDPGELLVLEHEPAYADAGIQVPAGGVDPGEEPLATAARELYEETGLRVDTAPVYLESRVVDRPAPSRVRHYVWMVAPPETPDRWTHRVSAGELDAGMLFWLSFRPRADAGLTPGYGWDSALDRLDQAISAR